MTLETFFEMFDQFADTPDAVAKMRELVLQLAVQGRLVPQSSDDEPADALAVTISEDRAAFVKARSLARQRVLAPVAMDQYPFDLPSRWRWTRLGNLCRVQAGFAFESAAFVQGESGMPMIRIRDITKDRTQVNYVGEYREEFLVDAGDYLVGMDGNFTVSKWRGPRALLNQRVSRLQWYSQHLEPSFFALAAQYRLSELQGTKAYTTVDHLSSGQIENVVVPLPPLSEQKRIVAKVDELMALCDRLKAQQQERETRHASLARASLARFADAPTSANLNFLFHDSYSIDPADIRKSILTLAVQGKLVPQDPNDEPAIHDLEQIEDEKRALIDARKLRPNLVSEISQTRDLQYELPESWRWFRLGDVAFFQEGPGIRNWQFRNHGIKLLNVQNIVDGHLVLDNTNRFISAEEFEATYRHFAVEPGDILFASSGASWGKATWFVDPGYTVMLNTSMIRLKFYSQRCVDAYLLLFLRTEFFKRQMEIQLVGIQPNFGSTHLGRVYIPIPPLAEQRRIVAKVDELMALVDALETQLATARTTAEKLMEAVVAELTTQD